ncbi:MAG: hypothetical protein J6V72_13320 [Kiritimatiellae bacterium]|nr:hypothetical protein [Kiritimatiellia bacterium]
MATFDFTCPQCGVTIEAEDSYRGMVLECPSCGKGIVVPRTGGVPRPKLKHVTQQEKQEDLNAVAIRRRLAEQEEAAAAERVKELAFAAKARKQRMLSALVKIVIAVVLVGAAAFGISVWRRHKAEQERVREEERQRMEAERKEREAEWQKKRTEAQQRQQEEAEKRAEAEKKRKEERERERAEQKRLREEREKERQDKIAAAESLKKELKERAEKFDRVGKLFSKATVDLWKNMPQDARPGTTEGVFYSLVPFDKEHGVYEVGSVTNGPMRVVELSKKEADEPLDVADYLGLVEKYGCLCLPADGGKVYVSVPKGSAGKQYTVPSSSVEPSSLLWGEGLCALIKRYSIGTQNLVYDVSYLPARGKALPLGQFAFGKPLGRSELQSAVLAAALKNWRPPKAKASKKAFRPTVVFYDGKTIKKGADGVTYVPRSPAGRVGSSYGKLYAEASRQEEMLAATQESQEDEAKRAKENFCEGVVSSIPDGSLQVSVKVTEEGDSVPQ